MINKLSEIFGIIINIIYKVCKNYGISLIIFTFFSKIILFPLNIIVQKNSIKMLKIKPKLEELKYKYFDDKEKFMEKQIELLEREKYKTSLGIIPLLIQIPIVLGLVGVIKNINSYISINDFMFLGINLNVVPTFKKYLIIPIIACASCLLLCYFQNKENILQKAENLKSKIITTLITTILTVYFVFLVPCGVGIYWILGNIFAIIQVYILNLIYPPERYINYSELKYWQNLNNDKQKEIIKNKKREKDDYKSFFKEENIKNMQLVFYSEKSGFYKYYKGVIEYIINNSDINIHYVTSDPQDNVFKLNYNNLKSYYIGKNKLIPLFMKLESNIVVMTTPDLQKYYLKRSIVKKDIEYVYMDHGMTSLNLTLREGALDYFDTIFANGVEQKREFEEMQKNRKMLLSNIVEAGFPLMDDLIEEYNKKMVNNRIKTILIAPSHQEDNILESCIDTIIEQLNNGKYKLIVRPHPQFIQRKKERIDELLEKYKDKFNDSFYFELDFSSNETIYNSDLIITDWSGIGMEYSLATLKPTLYINTKLKAINKNYGLLNIEPIDIKIRNKIGKEINKEDVKNIREVVDELINNQESYKNVNLSVRNEYLFNVGKSSYIIGEYIINKLEGDKECKD